MSMEDYEKTMKRRKILRNEVIACLKERELTFDEALNVLKDALSYLERASLGNKI